MMSRATIAEALKSLMQRPDFHEKIIRIAAEEIIREIERMDNPAFRDKDATPTPKSRS